jgi:hypothetical protein
VDTPLAETISEVLESVGGWAAIVSSSRAWIRNNPDTWKILIDYFLWVKGHTKKRIDGDMLDKVAIKHGVDRGTLSRLAKGFPDVLSEAVVKRFMAGASG